MASNNSKAFTVEWRTKHGELYSKATTKHPYVASIHDGSVDLNSYKRWLGQDYIFVKAFVRFISSVLLKLPPGTDDETLMTVLGGVAALHDELKWFQTQASVWSIDFQNLVPQHAAQVYCSFLEKMSQPDVDYVVALASFWTIEVVYSDSFAYCLEPDAIPPADLAEACLRWGSPDFRSYCQALKELVDISMQSATSEVVAEAEKAFIRVLELEVEFWNMSNDSSLAL